MHTYILTYIHAICTWGYESMLRSWVFTIGIQLHTYIQTNIAKIILSIHTIHSHTYIHTYSTYVRTYRRKQPIISLIHLLHFRFQSLRINFIGVRLQDIHTYIHTDCYLFPNIHTYIHTDWYLCTHIHTYIHTDWYTTHSYKYNFEIGSNAWIVHIHTYIHHYYCWLIFSSSWINYAFIHAHIHTYIHTYTQYINKYPYIHILPAFGKSVCKQPYMHTYIHTYQQSSAYCSMWGPHIHAAQHGGEPMHHSQSTVCQR